MKKFLVLVFALMFAVSGFADDPYSYNDTDYIIVIEGATNGVDCNITKECPYSKYLRIYNDGETEFVVIHFMENIDSVKAAIITQAENCGTVYDIGLNTSNAKYIEAIGG